MPGWWTVGPYVPFPSPKGDERTFRTSGPKGREYPSSALLKERSIIACTSKGPNKGRVKGGLSTEEGKLKESKSLLCGGAKKVVQSFITKGKEDGKKAIAAGRLLVKLARCLQSDQ
jgi:hypothetical protein